MLPVIPLAAKLRYNGSPLAVAMGGAPGGEPADVLAKGAED